MCTTSKILRNKQNNDGKPFGNSTATKSLACGLWLVLQFIFLLHAHAPLSLSLSRSLSTHAKQHNGEWGFPRSPQAALRLGMMMRLPLSLSLCVSLSVSLCVQEESTKRFMKERRRTLKTAPTWNKGIVLSQSFDRVVFFFQPSVACQCRMPNDFGNVIVVTHQNVAIGTTWTHERRRKLASCRLFVDHTHTQTQTKLQEI